MRLSIDKLHHHLSSKFEVTENAIVVSDTPFLLLKVRDTNALVDAINPQSFGEDERLPYWADLWTSSIELARWCLEDADIRGQRILELGCGLGLAGIAAVKAGAAVTFSDYEQDALDFARYNAIRNLSEETQLSNVAFIQLDWRNLPLLEQFDMIIAADVVYERRSFFPLIDVLTKLLKPKGCAVFTEPGRSIGEHFLSLLNEEGLHLTTTKHDVELEGKTSGVIRTIICNPILDNCQAAIADPPCPSFL